jgi:ATP-binding cassette, subfamily B (MDR/TAP), member 1
MALCFWFGFQLYLRHDIDSISTIVIVLMSVMMLTFSLTQTAAPIIAATKAASAAADFFAVIDAPKPIIAGLKDPQASATEDITFDSVNFAYPSRPHVKVLDDLSLRFERGKITAIVGASGSGKSTIVGLLERWYDLDLEKRYKLPKSAIKDKKVGNDKEEDEKIIPEEESHTPVALGGKILVG